MTYNCSGGVAGRCLHEVEVVSVGEGRGCVWASGGYRGYDAEKNGPELPRRTPTFLSCLLVPLLMALFSFSCTCTCRCEGSHLCRKATAAGMQKAWSAPAPTMKTPSWWQKGDTPRTRKRCLEAVRGTGSGRVRKKMFDEETGCPCTREGGNE
jgi:hypothetical protein